MKLTNEEIEAARKSITLALYGSSQIQEDDARLYLDALCAAARGDSLVGKRVRITGHCDGRTVAEEGVVDSQKTEYRIRAFNGFYRFYRDDFEVLPE